MPYQTFLQCLIYCAENALTVAGDVTGMNCSKPDTAFGKVSPSSTAMGGKRENVVFLLPCHSHQAILVLFSISRNYSNIAISNTSYGTHGNYRHRVISAEVLANYVMTTWLSQKINQSTGAVRRGRISGAKWRRSY